MLNFQSISPMWQIRSQKLVGFLLPLAIIAFGCCACRSQVGTKKHDTKLESLPTNADLYLVEAEVWKSISSNGFPEVAVIKAKSSNPGSKTRKAGSDAEAKLVAPTATLRIMEKPWVLVGVLGSKTGILRFKPTRSGDKFLVKLN